MDTSHGDRPGRVPCLAGTFRYDHPESQQADEVVQKLRKDPAADAGTDAGIIEPGEGKKLYAEAAQPAGVYVCTIAVNQHKGLVMALSALGSELRLLSKIKSFPSDSRIIRIAAKMSGVAIALAKCMAFRRSCLDQMLRNGIYEAPLCLFIVT